MKGVSMSLIILWGTPKHAIIFSLIKFVTTPPMALHSGMASAHLVKYIIASKIQNVIRTDRTRGPMPYQGIINSLSINYICQTIYY